MRKPDRPQVLLLARKRHVGLADRCPQLGSRADLTRTSPLVRSWTQTGHARPDKIDANERRCDILPLAEGRNSLDRILTRQSQPRHDACPRARPDLGVIANDWLAPLAAGDRIPPSISGGVASAR